MFASSVKVKDSQSGKRSIAHFYRDCQVWPRLNPTIVLASAPRPIHASTAKSLGVIRGASKMKLTAMLHRMSWIAGQRCFVRICIANDTKKTVKTVVLTLVRTLTLFKPKPHLDPGNGLTVDPDACQTATTHKVVAESALERSHSIAKGHASADGWWTGVPAGQEAQFSHWILIPVRRMVKITSYIVLTTFSTRASSSDARLLLSRYQQPEALSVSRSRLLEVDYSIRITVSAGALTSDVHVTLPVRIINFLSVDPTPSEPLLSPEGAYTRLVPYDNPLNMGTVSYGDAATLPIDASSASLATDLAVSSISSLGVPHSQRSRPPSHVRHGPSLISLDTPLCGDESGPTLRNSAEQFMETTSDADAIAISSESDSSIHSISSCSSILPASSSQTANYNLERTLGNLELDEDADSDEEVDLVVGTVQLDSGGFADFPRRLQDDEDEHHVDRTDTSPRSSGGVEPQSEAGDRAAYISTSYVDCSTEPMNTERLLDDPGPFEEFRPSRRDRRGHGQLSSADIFAPNPAQSSGARSRSQRVHGESSSVPWSNAIKERASRQAATHNYSALHYMKHGGNEDEDEGATPRLGPFAFASESGGERSVTTSESIRVSDVGSQRRTSRQLPQPPARLSQMCDIPASVSALESLRLSHLPVSHSVTPEAGDDADESGPRSSSSLSRSTAHRSLPTTPTREATSIIADRSVPSRPRYARFETAPQSLSGARFAKALHHTGQSESSTVQGRIAAFEERMKFAS